MRVLIASVGRLKEGAERTLLRKYTERIDVLGRQFAIGPLTYIEINESTLKSAKERKNAEAKALLAKLPVGARTFALDEKGKGYSSMAFAKKLQEERDNGHSDLAFLIGGADGHANTLMEQANFRMSLGPMTLPHGLARIILAEQIYRGISILAGHPYHRE